MKTSLIKNVVGCFCLLICAGFIFHAHADDDMQTSSNISSKRSKMNDVAKQLDQMNEQIDQIGSELNQADSVNVHLDWNQTSGTREKAMEKDNFKLYVSNQSFDIDPVDIKIMIDDRVVVNGEFSVGNQHNFIEYTFSLSKGNHTIFIESEKGNAKLEEDFEVSGKHWAYIGYWYYPINSIKENTTPTPRHFNFIVQNTPIYFK